MTDTRPDLARSNPSVSVVTGWTIFFMVLLRIAIGWHFFYEGVYKLVQPDWRATPYLTASIGPFRPLFMWFIKDADGLEGLTPESIKQRIDQRFDLMVKHYGITGDVLKDVETYKERKKIGDPTKAHDTVYVDHVFAEPDFQAELEDYKTLLAEIKAQEARFRTSAYETERLLDMYKRKATSHRSLMNRAEGPLIAMQENTKSKLAQEQLAKGELPPEDSPTERIDWLNIIALTAVGACLMLGLFTRLAAIGAAGLLVMYYFPLPPWPGFPASPMSEGHYLFINKNVIEAIALLMIATSRVGRWGGLDAYFSAGLGRRTEPAAAPARTGS